MVELQQHRCAAHCYEAMCLKNFYIRDGAASLLHSNNRCCLLIRKGVVKGNIRFELQNCLFGNFVIVIVVGHPHKRSIKPVLATLQQFDQL